MIHQGIEVGENFLQNCPFPHSEIIKPKRKFGAHVFRTKKEEDVFYDKSLLNSWESDSRPQLNFGQANLLAAFYAALIREEIYAPDTLVAAYAVDGHNDLVLRTSKLEVFPRDMGMFSMPRDLAAKISDVKFMLFRHGIGSAERDDDVELPFNYGTTKDGRIFYHDINVVLPEKLMESIWKISVARNDVPERVYFADEMRRGL